jgi:NAD(P)-dependent dehydrogenase (short-subunit alcohol dehydrogenase family)
VNFCRATVLSFTQKRMTKIDPTSVTRRVSEAFVERVARSDGKLIVTLTSGMGSIADNTSGGSIVYRSSKAAVNMVMRSVAIDLAPRRITCVVINPGWVRTDMGGANATLDPSESISRMRRIRGPWAGTVRQIFQSYGQRILGSMRVSHRRSSAKIFRIL